MRTSLVMGEHLNWVRNDRNLVERRVTLDRSNWYEWQWKERGEWMISRPRGKNDAITEEELKRVWNWPWSSLLLTNWRDCWMHLRRLREGHSIDSLWVFYLFHTITVSFITIKMIINNERVKIPAEKERKRSQSNE